MKGRFLIVKTIILLISFFGGMPMIKAQMISEPPCDTNGNFYFNFFREVYLGDATGIRLTDAYNCSDPVYLWLLKSQDKPDISAYNLRITFGVYYDNKYSDTFDACVPKDAGISDKLNLGLFDFECGQTIQLKDFKVISFESAFIDIYTPADITPPVVTCPVVKDEYKTDTGLCGANLSFTAAVTDNWDESPDVKYIIGGTELSSLKSYTFPAGKTAVLVTATDNAGNNASCSFDVKVADEEKPTITASGNLTLSADPGKCSASGVLTPPVTSDNCGIASLTHNAPSSFPAGTTIVTWTATDVNGNTSNYEQKVNVTDTESPKINCPGNIVTSVSSPVANKEKVNFSVTATDNCSVVQVTYSPIQPGGEFPVGTTTVHVKATDASGNTAVCDFTVTVNDSQAPVIACPVPNMKYNNDTGKGYAKLTFAVSATDNNDPNPVVIFKVNNNKISFPYEFPVGTTTVTAIASDNAGNSSTCSFEIKVEDNESPVITCSADVRVSNDPGDCYASGVDLGKPIVKDNLEGVSYRNNAPAMFPIGVTLVTWTAEDAAGNQSVCVQKVTVIDEEEPVITGVPADITVATDASRCHASGVKLGILKAIDNCSDNGYPLITNDGLTSYPLGETIVTWKVSDKYGNTVTHQQKVTVKDDRKPYFTDCPEDISVATYDPSGIAVDFTPVAMDDCDANVELTYSHAPGSVFPVGTTTVTVTATDDSGNWVICTFDVTVKLTGCIEIGACDQTYIVELYPITSRFGTVYRGYLDTTQVSNSIVASCGYKLSELDITYSKKVFTPADWGDRNRVTVKVYDGNQPLDSCEFKVVVRYPLDGGILSLNTGLDVNINENLSMTVSPNPTTGKMRVDFQNLKDPNIIALVYNTNGTVIISREVRTEGSLEIDLTGNTDGLYLIRTFADNKEFLSKILLQKR